MKPQLQTVVVANRVLAIVPLDQYDELREALEDAADAEEMRRIREDPDEEDIPIEMARRMWNRESAVRVWREMRGMKARCRGHLPLLPLRHRARREAGVRRCSQAPRPGARRWNRRSGLTPTLERFRLPRTPSAFVDVDPSALNIRKERINLSVPAYALREIDAYVQAHGGNRSGFLVTAALSVVRGELR